MDEFIIIKENPESCDETVAIVDGTLEDAKQTFLEVIRGQARDYQELKTLKKWKVIKLFDSNGNLIAKES